MLTDLYDGSIWAVVPEKLEALRRIAEMHDQGQRVDWGKLREAIMEQHGVHDDFAVSGSRGSAGNDDLPYQLLDGVAVINIFGTMMPRMSILGSLSGGCSCEQVRTMYLDAVARPSVRGVFLNIGSPGGNIDGVMELGETIYRSRGSKPTHAYTAGSMCSAAYWVGSAASRIVAINTALVGSIGVVATHVEQSEHDAKMGVKVTYVTAGKYKALGNPHEPLGKDAKGFIQGRVDALYSVFVENVSRNRGVSVEDASEKMADARVFVGAQALDAGLVDAVGTVDDAWAGLVDAMEPEAVSGDRPGYLQDVGV